MYQFLLLVQNDDRAIQQWILPRLSCAGNLQYVDFVFPSIFKYGGFI